MTNHTRTYESTMVEQTRTIKAPLATSARSSAEIDLRDLSEADLNSLQRKDPFMYHSIPSIHKAKLFNKDIDHSNLTTQESENDDLTSSIVSRKSRISTECHMSVLMEDLLNIDDDEFSLECEKNGFDFDLATLLGDAINIPMR
mmetsp:Transcript_15797/g.26975  ORF Transcript_15797/g.26975 Transcript_15797/m.26975 type:complete len:144 (+) Transcript_15797:124-555(+)|eukprot:CAMPEP_0183724228 /NCGR_PEP_ID=MMETSP0737-20130205/17735_1 /TAXON_ID=385413 /ORGANISM="Thalassiosira miniscula, Strain CCMP1093" /LENGTH=143 /DNA_ID=CAMNT_0025954769 /DNA_START=53 /DNA_END=484 /DNA_ORIENTATION=+